MTPTANASPDERPDYIPKLWRGGRLNSWVARSPRRVFFWFLVTPPLAVAGVGLLYFAESPGAAIFAASGTAVVVVQAVKYGPRAWRAWRQPPLRNN